MSDPYLLSKDRIKDPPSTFSQRLKHLGPGFILSASIVGSGELIATTTLGAKAGFVTFWVIIVSCFVKVAVQIEFAKHTILTGKTAMEIFNALPGKLIGKANWSVWLMLFLMVIKFIQVAGILGGVAIILNIIFPGIPIGPWSFFIAGVVALLIFRGYYKSIEKISIGLIAFFTLFTFLSILFIQYTAFAISWDDILLGLKFHLPKETVVFAIGAFGITGVGGDEILYYNYWCLEKGYAGNTGKKEDSPEWRARAKGWIKTMHLDAITAMIVYTVVTALFYLLGASVLYAQGKIPEGFAMIETLSGIYTESLGPGIKNVYLAGALLVLFSTLYAVLASWTRLFPDIFSQLGWINFRSPEVRKKWIAIIAWIVPVCWAILFLFIKLPVLMIISGGIAGSFILFLVVFSVFHIRYFSTEKEFVPGKTYDIILWASFLSIFAVGVYGIFKLI